MRPLLFTAGSLAWEQRKRGVMPSFRSRRMRFKIDALLSAVCIPAAAWGASPECAESPGRVLKVCVAVQDGRATFEVSRLGKPVLAPSALGVDFLGQPETQYSAVTRVKRSSSDTRWEQPWGEERSIRDHHTEMRVSLTGNTALNRRVEGFTF